MQQTFRLSFSVLLAGLVTAPMARAESYCVACYGPDAVYRCVIAGAPENSPPDPRNQMQCIKQIASGDRHARCSVERFSAAGCDGLERVISPSAALPIAPPPAGTTSAPALPATTERSESDASPVAEKTGEPPQTVEELAKNTMESTKKGISEVGGTVKSTTEKAGEKIGGVGSAMGEAAKKTWHCLTSFFSDC